MEQIPNYLYSKTNERVLKYLSGQSAHSDISSLLLQSIRPLGDVQIFCPDSVAYRYEVVSTNGIIFGYALGMRILAFRVDERMKDVAIRTGGIACPECGDEWVAVMNDHQGADWPEVDVCFWARKAYVYVREFD